MIPFLIGITIGIFTGQCIENWYNKKDKIKMKRLRFVVTAIALEDCSDNHDATPPGEDCGCPSCLCNQVLTKNGQTDYEED